MPMTNGTDRFVEGLAPSKSTSRPSGDQRGQPTSAPRPRNDTRRSVPRCCRRAQPDVVGLLAMRMERDPLAVRRPAHRLIFGIRVGDDFGGRRERSVGRPRLQDADFLRDVRILRIVQDSPPGAVRDRDAAAVGMVGRRLGLQCGQLAEYAGREIELDDRRPIALRLEEDRVVGRRRRRVAVAREAGDAARVTGVQIGGPQIDGPAFVRRREIRERPRVRERQRPDDFDVGLEPDRRLSART